MCTVADAPWPAWRHYRLELCAEARLRCGCRAVPPLAHKPGTAARMDEVGCHAPWQCPHGDKVMHAVPCGPMPTSPSPELRHAKILFSITLAALIRLCCIGEDLAPSSR